MDDERLKQILEAALLAAGRPLSVTDLEAVLAGDADVPPRETIRRALSELAEEWTGRSLTLQEVASGFRAQVRTEFEPWVARLWEEKPPRYSRALLETLAIIAYRQPITRSEIEEIRGVSVSTQIMRTLGEREWVRIVGHRDAPGKPAMYGTTRQFLDHFNLKTLDQLPPLSEIRDMNARYPELAFEQDEEDAEAGAEDAAALGNGRAADPVSDDAGADDTGADDTGADDTGADDTGDAVSSAEKPAHATDDVDGAEGGATVDAAESNPGRFGETKPVDTPKSGNDDPEDPSCTPAS